MKTLLAICSLIVASFCVSGQPVGITNIPPSDAKLAKQITGTWTKDTFNSKTFSWADPVIYTHTISPDGTLSYSFGHKSAPVTFQGTWLVKEGEFLVIFTNSYGTGKHGAEPVEGKVERCKIIHVDDHQFIYETGGHTNTLTR